MFSAGASQSTARTSPVTWSVTVYGGLPPGGVHAAVAAGAVEATVGGRWRTAASPTSTKRFVDALLGAGLAVGLEDPVQRQADDDDDEQQHAVQLDALQAPALEDLVVVVRLAVGASSISEPTPCGPSRR